MSSKAPAFQFYAADYLADEAVNLMSLEAEGAYTRLLAYCWREGSIPANEAQLSRLCKGAPTDVIQEVIGCFYPDPSTPGRLLHKRLESERAKQEEFRARQAAKGQKGGRPKKPDESPEKPPALSGLNPTKADEKPGESSSSSTSSSTSSSEDEGKPTPAPAPKPKPVERRLPLPAEDVELFNAQNWPSLTDPQKFAQVCAKLGFPQVDFERYRHQIAASLEGKEMPANSLRNWIETYLNNDYDAEKLLLPPKQAPNDRPSNYTGTAPYVPPVGGRIPDMSSIMNTNWKPPQG